MFFSRLKALWLQWRVVAVLAAALLLSGWLNVVQWKRAITAPLREQNADLKAVAKTNERIAEQAAKDGAALVADLGAIAERGRTERIVYRKAAAAAPLAPNCAPGQARQDAVNKTLGPKPSGPSSGETK